MNLINNTEKKFLKEQWHKGESLQQFALVHLQDTQAGWDWYVLNISGDEQEAHVISSSGLEKQIEKINFDELDNILTIYPDAIKKNHEFLPIKAEKIWKSLE